MARPIEKREHIERGVVAVVARKGLHATTIQDIAREAHVSPGLLYRYWENRDELAADAYRAHYEALVRQLSTRAATCEAVWDKLRAMLDEFLAFADANPVVLKFLLLSQHDLSSSIPIEKSVHALVGAAIRDGIAQGRLRAIQVDLGAQLFVGVVLQPVIGTIYGRLPGPVSQYADAMFEAAKRVLGTGSGKRTERGGL